MRCATYFVMFALTSYIPLSACTVNIIFIYTFPDEGGSDRIVLVILCSLFTQRERVSWRVWIMEFWVSWLDWYWLVLRFWYWLVLRFWCMKTKLLIKLRYNVMLADIWPQTADICWSVLIGHSTVLLQVFLLVSIMFCFRCFFIDLFIVLFQVFSLISIRYCFRFFLFIFVQCCFGCFHWSPSTAASGVFMISIQYRFRFFIDLFPVLLLVFYSISVQYCFLCFYWSPSDTASGVFIGLHLLLLQVFLLISIRYCFALHPVLLQVFLSVSVKYYFRCFYWSPSSTASGVSISFMEAVQMMEALVLISPLCWVTNIFYFSDYDWNWRQTQFVSYRSCHWHQLSYCWCHPSCCWHQLPFCWCQL